MKQSSELTKFYNDYNEWLINGALHSNKFEFTRGGCLYTNLSRWQEKNGYKQERFFPSKMLYEMQHQFHNAGLTNKYYPFGSLNYVNHTKNNTHHLDQNVINWVKSHLTQ